MSSSCSTSYFSPWGDLWIFVEWDLSLVDEWVFVMICWSIRNCTGKGKVCCNIHWDESAELWIWGFWGQRNKEQLMGMLLWGDVLQGIESSGSEYSDREIRGPTSFCSETHLVFWECKSFKLNVRNVTENPVLAKSGGSLIKKILVELKYLLWQTI